MNSTCKLRYHLICWTLSHLSVKCHDGCLQKMSADRICLHALKQCLRRLLNLRLTLGGWWFDHLAVLGCLIGCVQIRWCSCSNLIHSFGIVGHYLLFLYPNKCPRSCLFKFSSRVVLNPHKKQLCRHVGFHMSGAVFSMFYCFTRHFTCIVVCLLEGSDKLLCELVTSGVNVETFSQSNYGKTSTASIGCVVG